MLSAIYLLRRPYHKCPSVTAICTFWQEETKENKKMSTRSISSRTSTLSKRSCASVCPPRLFRRRRRRPPCPRTTPFTFDIGQSASLLLEPGGPTSIVDGVEPRRMFRDTVPSLCAGKACPGPTGTGGFHFSALTFSFPQLSHSACVCVTYNFDPATLFCRYFSHAHLNSYDPLNVCTNYLGDGGNSVSFSNPSQCYQFVLPAGSSQLVLVFENVDSVSTDRSCRATFTLSGLPCQGTTSCSCGTTIIASFAAHTSINDHD